MKIPSILLSTAIIVLVLAITPFASAQHLRERVIQKVATEKNEPIAITELKVTDQSVSLARPFVANDDWLKTLVISVKNTSEKRILFASIQLFFPRPSEERLSFYDVSVGNDQLMTRGPTRSEQLVGVAPGETVDFKLSTQDFGDLQKFLVGTGYSSSIEKLNLRIGHVIFEDDTMWYASSILRRDPNNDSAWVNK